MLEFRTPLGVELARGLTIQVRDNDSVNVAFARCELRGCVVAFFPEIYLMTAFRHTQSIDVRFAVAGVDAPVAPDIPEWEIVQARLPMHGFAAAVSRLR